MRFLSQTELTDVVTKIQMRVALNRSLYFWAYKLQEYGQSQLTLMFNVTAYVWQFLGAAVVFTLINIALLKMDAHTNTASVNIHRFLRYGVYSVSTLALNEPGGGVVANGNVADILRLIVSFYGGCFSGRLLD